MLDKELYRLVRNALANKNTVEMEEIAKASKVSVPTLYVWRSWGTSNPQTPKIQRVANHLGIINGS